MRPRIAGIPDDEPWLEKSCEWVDGQAIEKPNGMCASVVGARLLTSLHKFTEDHDLGSVVNSRCGYQCFADQPSKVRKPDISFIARGRFRDNQVPVGNVRFPPDLACEVVGVDGATELEQRVADFLGVGTRIFWIVYTATHSIYIVRQDGSAVRLTESQSLSGEDVIPGFTLPLAALFDGI